MALVASRRHVLLSRLFVLPTAAGHARQGKKKKKSVSSRHATCRWRLSLRTASVRITVQHISQHGRLPPRDRSEGWGWRREGGRRQEEDMYTFSRNWNTVRLFSFLLVTDRDLASLCHQSKRKKKNRIKQQCQGRRPSAAVSVTGSSDPGGLSAMGTQPLHCGVLKKSRLIFYTFFFCFFCSWRQQAKKVACAGVSSTICAHVVSCRH